MTPSEEVGGGERARRFFRALRLRMSEIVKSIMKTMMKRNKAPTPILTATFIRGPGGALLCAWLLVVLFVSDVAGVEEEGEEDVGVESDAEDCDIDVDALPWDEDVGAEDGVELDI